MTDQIKFSDKLTILGIIISIVGSSTILSLISGLFIPFNAYVYVKNVNSSYSIISIINLSNDLIDNLNLHIVAPFYKQKYSLSNFSAADVKFFNATHVLFHFDHVQPKNSYTNIALFLNLSTQKDFYGVYPLYDKGKMKVKRGLKGITECN